MTALILLALLIAGGVGYWSWASAYVANGAPAWWFVLGAPIAYLAPVVGLVALWFALSWIWRTPRPPDAQLGFGGSLRLFANEVRAVALSWPAMALHRLFMLEPAAAPARRPVILVHGVLVNDGAWFGFRRRLLRLGIGPVYTVNLSPPYAGIDHFARQLAERIEAVCAATGAQRVALVCHSMGGLVARAYIRAAGAARLECVVTIGTPHHGSVLAWMWFGQALAQMRPGNSWLVELNSKEAERFPVPLMSIWSRLDSMVAPQASSELAVATNVAVIGVGHNALLTDRQVVDVVARHLRAAPGDTPRQS
jgi:triacylglycerol esterase/lipase EstA (alpha/beta hydrolase family)